MAAELARCRRVTRRNGLIASLVFMRMHVAAGDLFRVPDLWVEVLGMIDTGAQINLVQAALVERLDGNILPTQDLQVLGANNKPIDIAGETLLKGRLGLGEIRLRCLVVEQLPHQLILAMPFFQQHRIKLDLGSMTASCRRGSVVLEHHHIGESALGIYGTCWNRSRDPVHKC